MFALMRIEAFPWRVMGIPICLLLLVLAGCGATEEPPPEETAPDSEWLLPAEGLEWRKMRLLAVFAFPLDIDPSSLEISLNGVDRTEDFLPAGLISHRWRKRSAGLADEGDGAGGLDMSQGFFRRVQGIVERDMMAVGENRLVARYTSPGKGPREVERRFVFRPGERIIRCEVVRRYRDREDATAGARIVVIPEDGAPEIDLSVGSSHAVFTWGPERRRAFALAREGEAAFYLPRGRYRAVATGGLLEGVAEWIVPEEGDAEHLFVLEREVDLDGTVTADFHVHASPSVDSLLPLKERLRSYLAAGVDVMVATDHNIITDYGPVIEQMPAAAGRIRSLPGVEASVRSPKGTSYGHWNFWPLEADPTAPPNRVGQITSFGALALPVPASKRAVREGPVVPEMYEAYRRQGRDLARRAGIPPEASYPDVVIQLNHPRGMQHDPKTREIRRAHDWFNVIGLDLSQGIPEELTRPVAGGLGAMDFDVLEVWNRSSRRLYEEVREDWFALMNLGYYRSATANSDSHTVSPELAGHPMNIVFLAPGQPAGVDVRLGDLVDAVRAGRVVGTDGPIPLLSVEAGAAGAGPGEVLSAPGGRVSVRVEVRAASWVPVGEIRLWANGELLARTDEGVLELKTRLTTDTWLVAEVGDLEGIPEAATVPGLYGLLVPRGLAMGFTNPVFVEVDGTRRFPSR